MDSGLYDSILQKLKDSDLIKYFSINASKSPPNDSELIRLSENVSKIFINNNTIFYLNADGDEVQCPNVDSDVSGSGDWLSDHIPAPDFDVAQGGNVRKSSEAESYFICATICAILKDDIFTSELKSVTTLYDFDVMTPTSGKQSFGDLLSDWQSLQSTIINVIISAAKYSISNQKKESELFLKDGLPATTEGELRDLGINIKNVNAEYSRGDLSPQNVILHTKIDKLRFIDDKNCKINRLISDSNVGDLYKTLKLSSEYLDPIDKKRISNFCITEVERAFAEDCNLSEMYGDVSQVVSKLRKRAFKTAVSSLKRECVIRYINDPASYVLPRKG